MEKQPTKLMITQNQIIDDIKETIQNINKEYPKLLEEKEETLIIGIARGGLQLAQYLSYSFGNRNLETISSRLYEDMVKNSETHTINGLENINLRRYKNVIIVDDIYDTGETMETATKIIREEAPKVKVFQSVIYSQQKVQDLIVGKHLAGEWVVFPWDDLEIAHEEPNEIS